MILLYFKIKELSISGRLSADMMAIMVIFTLNMIRITSDLHNIPADCPTA